MNEQLSYEDLLKSNAALKQQIATLERSLKELKAAGDVRARMVDIFRSTPQMMAISNLNDGKYLEVNNTFLETLGYNRDEIIGRNSDDINLFADLVQSDRFIRKLARLKKVKDFEVNVKRKDGVDLPFKFSAETIILGEERYLLTSYSPLRTESNDKADFDRTFERLRDLFESLQNFVMIVNPDDEGKKIVEFANINSREFRNLSEKDVIGKDISALKVGNREVIEELLATIILTGQPHKQTILNHNKEDEGYYFGIRLNTGEILVMWEPGAIQKSRENDLLMTGSVFERFADMIPNGVFEISRKGRITYSNMKGLSQFGYTREDIENGLTIRNIFRDQALTQLFNDLKQLTNPGDNISREYVAYHANGTALPVIAHVTGIFDQAGKMVGYRGIVTDLSDKQRIEDQILREKIHLETLIESAPESIVQTTHDGTIERINAEFTREFGWSAEEVIGKNIDDVIIPPDIVDEGKEYTKRASKSETIAIETFRQTKWGEKIYVSVLIKPVKFNDETSSLFAIYRNITEKRRDSDLKDAILNISNVALRQSDFNDIFSIFRTEIGKLWDTKNFYIVLYNEENQTLSLPFYTDEKDKFDEIPTRGTLTGWLIKNEKPKLLLESDIAVLENRGEVDLVGTPCKVWLGVPLTINRKIIGAMVLQDYDDENAFKKEDLRLLNLIGNQIALVIQRKDMMTNLIIERKKAEDAARLKQQFMSTMSHEIRTPLNEVIGITNLLLQGNPRPDQMEFIKTLRFSANHLLTLVNDVLDFNKMESGMIVFEKTQFNLVDFINDLKRTYSFRTDEKGLELKIEFDNTLPTEIIGDPIRLNQVLSNLLSNAVKFTSDGFIGLSIEQTAREDTSVEIKFTVTDSGIGIPADKHDAIFEVYTQAAEDTTRKYGGTGLGLSIVKKLIELQGSSIFIESEPGEGSSFWFTLRFSVGKVSEKEAAVGDDGEDSFNGLQGKRILIAEDNKINFFVANKFLTKWGIDVTHAENGRIALDMIGENEFDLVLMDLHMPVMDGIEATRLIRESEDPKVRDIPVVALTAAIMSEHEDKIDNLNINDYILKPFKPKELYQKILRHTR